jgi:hypothetical protein
MLDAIAIFLIGLICGIAAGGVHLRQQRKKIKFYETYIHRRLEETALRVRDDLRPR